MSIILPGVVESDLRGTITKGSSAPAQALTAATEAVITGSVVRIPDCGLVVGSKYKLRFVIDKTGAGSATSAFKVAVNAPSEAVSVANADAVLSFTKPAGTAVADVGVVELELEVVAVGDAAEDGSVVGSFLLSHNLAATGHAQVPVVALQGADASTATILNGRGGAYIYVTATTGASDVSSVYLAEASLATPAA